MGVSAPLAIIGFICGSGLIVLGAVFFWRFAGQQSQNGWATAAATLPVGVVTGLAAMLGQTEMAVGLLWGTVALNLGFMGILRLLGHLRITRQTGLIHCLWLALGLGSCLLAGRQGNLGIFGGLSLVTVGLIAVWLGLRQPTAVPTENVDTAVETAPRPWWQWGLLVISIAGICLGAWLVVQQQTAVMVVMGIPPTVFGAAVMAPLCGLVGWTGLGRKQLHSATLSTAWSGANRLFATVGLGLAALLSGGLRLTLTTMAVILPWVAGMAVISVVALCLPNKTARWWGGLVVIMYGAYLISLFW